MTRAGVLVIMHDSFVGCTTDGLVARCYAHGIETWGYHADSREAAIRCVKFDFTNIIANAPHERIADLDEIGRRVGK